MKILYVLKDGLPDSAAGMRVDAIASVLEASGHSVDILSERPMSPLCHDTTMYKADILYMYNNRKYFFEIENPKKNKVLQYLTFLIELLFARRTFNRIVQHINSDTYQVIILYNESFILTDKLLKFCKKRDISLVGDVTEWYEKVNNINHFEQIIRPRSVNRRIIKLDHRLDGIIAISPYLFSFYKQKGVNVVFVPPIIKFFSKPKNIVPHSPVVLVYAGSPGEKDLLLPLIISIDKYNRTKGLTFELKLIGIGEEYLNTLSKNTNDYYGIEAFGRLSHDSCIEIITGCDFSFLMRRPLRYAMAGFSTKFSEAMSLGVPMICNKVGGCDTLIEDGIDGFLISNTEVDTIYNFLHKLDLFCQSSDNIKMMKENAFIKAKNTFSESTYQEVLNSFVKGLYADVK